MPEADFRFHSRRNSLKDYWGVSHERAKCTEYHKPSSELNVHVSVNSSLPNKITRGRKRSRSNLYDLRPRKLLRHQDPHGLQTESSMGLPLDVILVIVEYASLQEILALSQTCSRLRHLARLYLEKLGILNSGPTTIGIRLVGGPFSAPTMSLLRNLVSQINTPRMTILIDFYHVTSFLCDIQQLLRTNTITSFELAVFNDEHILLGDSSLSGSLLNILSHLSNSCKRLRFTAGPEHPLRPSLYQLWTPVYTPRPGRLSIRNALASLTEVNLSSPLFYQRSLKDSVSFLLHHPKVTSFSLTCLTASESDDVLSTTCLPALENLSIRVTDATLVILPDAFLRSHRNVRYIHLSALFLWNEASFKPCGIRIKLPPLASATVSLKYAGFDIVDSSSFLDLHIYSFMAFPVPENRGYCDAVQSLVDIWLNSQAFEPVGKFTASFTFPRRLSNHLSFCRDAPIYRCSCTPDTLKGKLVHGLRRIKIFLDHITQLVIPYLSRWIRHFPDIQELVIIAELVSVDANPFPIDVLRDGSPNIQLVNCTTTLHS